MTSAQANFYNNGNKTFLHGNFHLVEDMLEQFDGVTVNWDMDGKLDVCLLAHQFQNQLDDLYQIATTAGMLLNFRAKPDKNLGKRLFETDASNGVRAMGCIFIRFHNDGDLDALNGNGMDDPETTDDDWAVNQHMKLYVNHGEDERFRMVDEAKLRGIENTQENRGAMTFDYDNDGDLDVFVVNHAESPSFYRNDGGNYYDFLRVKVYERPGGRESVGATVFLKLNEDDEVEQIREIGSTAAFLGQGESTAHFGLGLRGHEELLHKVTVRYFTQPEEVNNTTEETKLIEHNLEFFYSTKINISCV